MQINGLNLLSKNINSRRNPTKIYISLFKQGKSKLCSRTRGQNIYLLEKKRFHNFDLDLSNFMRVALTVIVPLPR